MSKNDRNNIAVHSERVMESSNMARIEGWMKEKISEGVTDLIRGVTGL